ncbi:sensor histidine kinase [Streptomyces oceani]|uniref:histidine kinase n=1 Tax=Streptomyces oceani TaxID=1075402 RepID=A0A1E7KLB1_9ACTN|nr:sensor histidine kinase [Streptomyces oceani]OEV04591.1 histidine kinase [Streptomyces oceani]
MRFRGPRRVFSQVLVMQLALITGVTALVSGLFLAPLSDQLDRQAMRRALAIAQSTATRPGLVSELNTPPSPDGPVQREAEQIREATGAAYVVVLNEHGIRWSHPSRGEVGRHVSTDPGEVLAGREVMHIDAGTLGPTARGKAPLRNSEGRVVGAVSVGIDYASVRNRLLSAVPDLLAYSGAALAAGSAAAYAVAFRLRRRTHDLAFSDISALLDEREAMLHGIREGVVALDPHGRTRLVNDEAQRLIGLRPADVGRHVTDVLGEGRAADVLSGRATGEDLLTVSGARVLVANRMPTDDGGAVITLRDRTELERLGRELDSTRSLLDALRAQDHEHANRLHALLGLLELGLYSEAQEFITEVLGVHQAAAEQVAVSVHDPLIAALLVGKAAVAAERGVALWISPTTLLPNRVVDPNAVVTVIGNLVDNALDAATGTPEATVAVELRAEGRTLLLQITDTGPGIPPEQRDLIFTEGWTTKKTSAHRQRGIGLSLVRRLTERFGGEVSATALEGGGAEFSVVLPETLANPEHVPRQAYGAGDAS